MHTYVPAFKLWAMILLAIYLILSGLADITDVYLPYWSLVILGLIGLIAGIFILLSLDKCVVCGTTTDKYSPTNPNDKYPPNAPR
jgi:hypothetical protein